MAQSMKCIWDDDNAYGMYLGQNMCVRHLKDSLSILDLLINAGVVKSENIPARLKELVINP